MRHQTAQFYLEGFTREELAPSLRIRLDQHLSECDACTRLARETAPLSSVFEGMGGEGTPEFEAALDSVRQCTMKVVRAESEQGSRILAWFGSAVSWQAAIPVTMAAAVLFVLLVSPASHRLDGTSTAPQESETVVAPAVVEDARLETPASSASRPFLIEHTGSEVQIHWRQTGRPHRVRKGADPVSVAASSGQSVSGRTWNDPENHPVAGTVTYYLID